MESYSLDLVWDFGTMLPKDGALQYSAESKQALITDGHMAAVVDIDLGPLPLEIPKALLSAAKRMDAHLLVGDDTATLCGEAVHAESACEVNQKLKITSNYLAPHDDEVRFNPHLLLKFLRAYCVGSRSWYRRERWVSLSLKDLCIRVHEQGIQPHIRYALMGLDPEEKGV